MSKQAPGEAVKADPAEFRRRLVVECNGEPRRLVEVLDPWQAQDFAALDSGWQVVAGVKPKSKPLTRAYFERPRGHSKTTDIAIMAAQAIYAAPHRIRGVAASGDSDQARLVLNAVDMLCRFNPALSVLDVQRGSVVNRETGSELAVISSDSATSWGLLPDFVICDEVTHWKDNGEVLWHSLLSSAAKRAKCLLCVISNAGLGAGDSWQWKIREAARTDPRWYFSRLDGPQASWITPEILDEQRRHLPPTVFNRVWMNEWSTSAGDALEEADVRAAVKHDFNLPDGLLQRPVYVFGALDLGIRKDHTALVGVIADCERQQIHHCYSQSWVPPIGGEVDLASVETAVEQFAWEYPGANIVADPWQAASLIQRLQARGIRIHGMPSTPKNLSVWATQLIAAFRNRQITLMNDPELVAQLMKLRIVENPVGFKLQAPRDRIHGHCDKAIALSMGVGEAMEAITGYTPVIDDGLGAYLI